MPCKPFIHKLIAKPPIIPNGLEKTLLLHKGFYIVVGCAFLRKGPTSASFIRAVVWKGMHKTYPKEGTWFRVFLDSCLVYSKHHDIPGNCVPMLGKQCCFV